MDVLCDISSQQTAVVKMVNEVVRVVRTSSARRPCGSQTTLEHAVRRYEAVKITDGLVRFQAVVTTHHLREPVIQTGCWSFCHENDPVDRRQEPREPRGAFSGLKRVGGGQLFNPYPPKK